MALITKTPADMPTTAKTARQQAQQAIVQEAIQWAATLSVMHDIPAVREHDKLGLCFLTKVRRRGGRIVETVYSNEQNIINAYINKHQEV